MKEKKAFTALLIYPPFDTVDTFWSYHHSLKLYAPLGEFGFPKRLLPPLGLMGLFAYLKPYYQHIQLVDKNVDPRPIRQFIQQADHVYMGGMLAQEKALINYAEQVKQTGKTLIVGGTAVTQNSPLVNIADFLVENEAEGVIDDLLNNLFNQGEKKYFKGTAATTQQYFQPDYASINLDNYVHMAVQISRGCPEQCEFCDIPMRFGKAFRVTPWKQTELAFKQLKELGWKGQVFIVDDNFIGHPKRTLQILKNLYQIGESIGYHHPKYTEMTLRIADESPIMHELRLWLRKAHFINGFYGVETPNEASLLETRKKQNLRGETSLQEKLAFISKQTGSGTMMGMIYGFDHDTHATVTQFIDFVNSSSSPVVMAGLLNALPCTPLLERIKKQGRYVQSTSGNNSDGVINFIPNHFSIQEAEQNYLSILQAIYHPDAYFVRVMRHLNLIDPNLQSQYRAERTNQINYLLKILTHKNALIFWRYLPQAIKIAKTRCGKNSSGFKAILAEFFSLCGQYTHYVHQVNVQRERIINRNYADWQKVSWQQLKMESTEKESHG